MYLVAPGDPVAMVAALARAAAKGEDSFVAALERVPAAAYRTDRDGTVTHFNSACATFAGRKPAVGRDQWCVTWKLYTNDGAFLPHDQCPMAVALRENREVRGARAVAERPDGVRVPFAPYPTPLRDRQGNLVGAVNLLVDLSDEPRARTDQPSAGEAPRRARAMRHFRAIFAAGNAVGLDTLAFAAAGFSEAFATLVTLDCRRPFQLWCDGTYFGRFQRVVEGSASYWRLLGEPYVACLPWRATPGRAGRRGKSVH